MAAKRQYGYYIKGNKIAIIERGVGSGVCSLSGYSNQTTCEAAGGTWTENAVSTNDGEYRSPVATVAGGLEIQYAYSPTFNLQSTGKEGTDFHRFVGWGSNGVELLLFAYGPFAVEDLSSFFAADDWIYISGSGRWSGLHQVKSTGGTTGILTLKTKCNLKPSYITVTINVDDDETYTGSNPLTDGNAVNAFKDAQSYRSTAYVYIDGPTVANEGLFSLTTDTTTGRFTVNKKINVNGYGDYTLTPAISSDVTESLTIYNAFYEQIFVYESVDVMDDEAFDLDLPRYQANAIVYYLKAQLAEDRGDIEQREFFMREFKRQLEKSNSANKRGPYIVQGFKEMR